MGGFCRSVSQHAGRQLNMLSIAAPSSISYPHFEVNGRCLVNEDGTSPSGGAGNGGTIVMCKCLRGTSHTVLGGDGGFQNGFCAVYPGFARNAGGYIADISCYGLPGCRI